MKIKSLLGKRIKELRKRNKLTQEKLAELIGIETVSLCNIENGKYYPSSENLEKIINILKVSPKDLFDFEHKQKDTDLLKEINILLKQNPNRIQDAYNIIKAIIK